MKTIITTLFIAMATIIPAQEDVVRSMINRTEISILKSQKEILGGNVQQKPQELSLAVKYQVLAVEAFKNNKSSAAVCYSYQAREHALGILKEAKISGLDFYMLNSDEQALINENKCSDQSAEMEKHIPAGVIDNSELLDPVKLSATYKISLN